MTAYPPAVPRPASIGRRMGAFAIDVAISGGLAIVLGIVLVVVVMGSSARRDYALVAVVATVSYAVLFACLLAWWLVYSAMQGGHGSIGQRALGLRVHDASSAQPIGFWRAVLRNLVWGLAGSIVVGYFTPLFDSSPRRQGWHDLAARATVVDVRGTTDAVAAASRMRPVNPYVAAPPLTASAAPGPGARPASTAYAAPLASSAAPTVPVMVAAARPTPGPVPPAYAPPPAFAPAPRAYAAAPPAYAPAPPAYAPAQAPTAFAPTAFAPAPTPTALAPALVPAGAALAEDVERTRVTASVAPPAQRAALYPEAPVLAVLTWDDGTRMAVYGRTLYGRNPAGEAGAVTVAVRDETLSLSKTHFEIGRDERGPWIVDRHSTNGTVLLRDGGRHPLVPGVRTTLRDADRLELGDRSTTVGVA